ncbi:MAG: Protein-L-isoaspartate O-methyltransferase [Pseudomonadota bacterium]
MSRVPRWMDRASITRQESGRRSARVSQPDLRPTREGADLLPQRSEPGYVSDRARAAMVDALRQAGVGDPAVLAALISIPRHQFVEAGLSGRAYEDVSLPIGHAQTISRPYTVARMIELLAADLDSGFRGRCKVLEIGTGCGYQAAVLARIFGEVISVERIRGLHEQARANLRSLRLGNLRLVYGDGLAGLPSQAPFDLMIAAAAGDQIPRTWLEQMTVGGRLVAPVASGDAQALHFVRRTGATQWSLQVLDTVRFVPLRDGLA